jgi:hypothetical protein
MGDLNPLTLITPKNLGIMEHKMGSDRMFLRYAYHKPFMVKFPDRYE